MRPVGALEVWHRVEGRESRHPRSAHDLGDPGIARLQIELDRGFGSRAERICDGAPDDTTRGDDEHQAVTGQPFAYIGESVVDTQAEVAPRFGARARTFISGPGVERVPQKP